MKIMIALAALELLAAPVGGAPGPVAQSRAYNGHSVLGASDRAAVAELRAAEAHLVADLQGDDRLAWVKDYTEDAVFQEGSDEPVSGRAALTALARSLPPLSSVSIEPVRTMIQGRLAYVEVRGGYAVGRFRGVMIWRKDPDGQWRMLHEMLAPEPAK
jgi:ketosteroid isomerase-like protein